MKAIRSIIPLGCTLIGLASAPAQQAVTVTSTFKGVNKAIPDGSAVGVTDKRTLSLPGVGCITDIQVCVNIVGGFNGDLYGYLVHEQGFVVLLNRPGRRAGKPMGYEDAGLTVVFSRTATNDVHNYGDCATQGSSSPTEWAPDGRETDPQATVETSPRTSTLDSFLGTNPNGEWTLFLADVCTGEQATLTDWTLKITATVDPNALPSESSLPPLAANSRLHQ